MQNFLASVHARSHPVTDIEQGYISTASCILANNSMKLGEAWRGIQAACGRRFRGKRIVTTGISGALHDPQSLGRPEVSRFPFYPGSRWPNHAPRTPRFLSFQQPSR